LSRLVLSTTWQGHKFNCYWRSTWRQLTLDIDGKAIKLNTWFVRNSKPVQLQVNNIKVQVEFKKLLKEKAAVIILKVEGIILKMQAIALKTGATLPMSSITYHNLKK